MERFPTAMVSVLPRHCSDHAPLLLQTEIAPPTGRRPFRFERVWLEYQDLHDEIEKAWIGNLRSSPMGGLQRKLWTLQERLRGWNRRRVGDLPQRVQQAQNTLDKLMIEEQRSNSDFDYCVQLRQATNHLTALERQLEIFWAQRARQAWVREGVRNTRYFHQKVLRRRSRNRLEILRTESGELLHGDINVKSYVVKYFEDHWRSRVDSVSQIPPELIRRHLSSEMAEELVKPFTDEEIELGLEQRAFVPNRSMHAHLLLVQDIMHSLHIRRGRHALMAAKIDLASAYDSVEWGSLFQPTLVSEMLGTKYHWNGNPWEFHIPQRASAIWRALCMGLRALRTHVRKVADNTKPTQWVWDESPYLTPHLKEVYYLLLPSPFAADTQTTTRAAGAAFILIQEDPHRILGVGYWSWPWATPIRAEAEAIRLGLHQARTAQLKHILVCTDAETLLCALSSPGPGPPQLQDCISSIRSYDRAEDPLLFVKVPRENVYAPELIAKYARDNQLRGFSKHLQKTWVRRLLSLASDSISQCKNYVWAFVPHPHVVFVNVGEITTNATSHQVGEVRAYNNEFKVFSGPGEAENSQSINSVDP
ncbi:hypothetical protein QJS10_CPB04g01081 [Acorus calamus]|uniref:RNase H type-1 domain-containing protein n=1 Tax=Acorus calamus TaxID=4465 RepID=A0AAV9EZL4_ACOCL|nr:hypothetical protein QJS10_CPB04g01081 [Acorus calamus]